MSEKLRGFEVVDTKFRTAFHTLTDEKGKKYEIPVDIKLPVRSDVRSAGYDFFLPKDIIVLPGHKTLIFSDVKAYMQPDEILQIHIRSSLGIKQGLILSNITGIIDSSYYSNPDNDGNIGLALLNTSGTAIKLREGERVAQGIFIKYLTADNDQPTSEERKGGIGSSGK